LKTARTSEYDLIRKRLQTKLVIALGLFIFADLLLTIIGLSTGRLGEAHPLGLINVILISLVAFPIIVFVNLKLNTRLWTFALLSVCCLRAAIVLYNLFLLLTYFLAFF